MSAPSSYKLKKGESLEHVAKAHKLQVDEIWKYAPNGKLVSKRHSPDKCEPGDVVELPMSKAEKQAALDKVAAVIKTLKLQSDLNSASQKKLEELLANLETTNKAWMTELAKISKKVKDDGMTADIANMFAGLATAGASLVKSSRQLSTLFEKKGAEALKAAGEIEKTSHGMVVTSMEAMYGPFSPLCSAATSGLAETSKSDNVFVSAIGTAADWFGQISSPSGWAQFITGVDNDLGKAGRQILDQYLLTKNAILRRQNALRDEAKSIDNTRVSLERAYQNIKKG